MGDTFPPLLTRLLCANAYFCWLSPCSHNPQTPFFLTVSDAPTPHTFSPPTPHRYPAHLHTQSFVTVPITWARNKPSPPSHHIPPPSLHIASDLDDPTQATYTHLPALAMHGAKKKKKEKAPSALRTRQQKNGRGETLDNICEPHTRTQTQTKQRKGNENGNKGRKTRQRRNTQHSSKKERKRLTFFTGLFSFFSPPIPNARYNTHPTHPHLPSRVCPISLLRNLHQRNCWPPAPPPIWGDVQPTSRRTLKKWKQQQRIATTTTTPAQNKKGRKKTANNHLLHFTADFYWKRKRNKQKKGFKMKQHTHDQNRCGGVCPWLSCHMPSHIPPTPP
eukprot:Rhum_TRINITY_DN14519_c10_g1::Rhum_TRINITY_DN14519_c10_g1_i1::g.95150::m.95150